MFFFSSAFFSHSPLRLILLPAEYTVRCMTKYQLMRMVFPINRKRFNIFWMFIPSIVDPKIFCSRIFFFPFFNLRIIVDKISVTCSFNFIYFSSHPFSSLRLSFIESVETTKLIQFNNQNHEFIMQSRQRNSVLLFFSFLVHFFPTFSFSRSSLSLSLSPPLCRSPSVIRSFSFSYTPVPMWYLCSLFCVLCAQVCLAKLRSRDSFGFGKTN